MSTDDRMPVRTLRDLLEPDAAGYAKTIEISQAISTRRQAAALERIATVLEKMLDGMFEEKEVP